MSTSPSMSTTTPDWQPLPQSGSGHGNSLAIPSSTSPPPVQRAWGLNSLGGEALTATNRASSVSRRTSNMTDPIGSRPGSRLDAAAIGPSSAKKPSTRPSASAAAGVMAAASSAAARSRATSPALSAHEAASFYQPSGLRFDRGSVNRSSSASFMTARNDAQAAADTSIGSNGSFFGGGVQRPLAGTPKLVVDEPEMGLSTKEADGIDANLPSSPSNDLSSSFASLMGHAFGQTATGNAAGNAASGPTLHVAPQPLRSEPMVSLSSNSLSSASPSHPDNAHLSPAAASSFSGAFGQFGTTGTVGNAYPFPGGLSSPSLMATNAAPPVFPTLTDRSGVASPGYDSFRLNNNASVPAMTTADLDGSLPHAKVLLDLTERVSRTENGLRDMNRSIVGLNRNMGILLERTKHLGGPQQPVRVGSTPVGMGGPVTQSDEIRALSTQMSLTSASMSQLMAQVTGGVTPAGMAMPSVSAPSNGLAGLGLGGATPQLGGGSNVTTPQLGTFPGTPAYANGSRFGGMHPSVPPVHDRMSTPSLLQQQQHGGSHPHQHIHNNDRHSRLSPRPGASPGPNSRRWSSMVPGTPDVNTGGMTGGAMNPPDPSVIVTKWEHLNLHPDLLRSILKYGLGPPNKIQQRALPFLLRGSDIIAQAPPTQERIASYVIPVLQLVLNVLRGEAILPSSMGVRGPMAIIISTTVDQATQAQRMAMGLGAALGIRVHIAAASSLDVAQEASALIQTQPQIVVGTPQKMMDLFHYLANNTKGAVSLEDIRSVVLDEVDQLIARNLADYVSTLLRILPAPRIVQLKAGAAVAGLPSRVGMVSPVPGLPSHPAPTSVDAVQVTHTDRQTAIFSNTVPQDVLNFAQSIHLRESVRVLVRREGGATVSAGLGNGGAGLGGAGGSGFQGVGNGAQAGPGALSSAAHPSASALMAGQPINALGASPANNHANPLNDPILSSLRGLRQYYLYVAVTTGGGGATSPTPGMASSRKAHAHEMKLDVITDLLEDIDFGHAVVYTATAAAHEAVTYKLASKGIEALGLHRDMAPSTRQQVLAKYRSSIGTTQGNAHLIQSIAGQAVVGGVGHDAQAAQAALQNVVGGMASNKKALVVHDVHVAPEEVHQVPLIVFYDLPRSVDEYKDKIVCAASGGPNSRPSVCVNVVTGSGGPRGDIEMLRTLECHLGCKMAELPMNASSILQF